MAKVLDTDMGMVSSFQVVKPQMLAGRGARFRNLYPIGATCLTFFYESDILICLITSLEHQLISVRDTLLIIIRTHATPMAISAHTRLRDHLS